MLEIWDEVCGDQDHTYTRLLYGQAYNGKSYLSYFLAAKAYAEGWLVLYISDAAVLDTETQDEATVEVVKRFLALNRDILTGSELEMLVSDYDGEGHMPTRATYKIFRYLLKSSNRKTLLLVDEHDKLFENQPYVTTKFKSLNHLECLGMWGETATGSRVLFTETEDPKSVKPLREMSFTRNVVNVWRSKR